MPTADSDYQCAICGMWFPVRVLARDCEDGHRGDSRETPDAGPQD